MSGEWKMLDELLADDSDRLTDWEVRFLESLNTQRHRELSPKQVAALESIWDRIFG